MKKRLSKFTLAAGIVLALAFTFSSCSADGDEGSSKGSCINAELEVKANTLDEVTVACNATRSEVLSQLQNSIGSCSKYDLAFDKPIKDIMNDCGVSEIPIGGGSSSSKGTGGSSSSNGGSGGGGGKGNNISNYRTVLIGTQTWMAENLNYAVEGGKCYGEGGKVVTYDYDSDDNVFSTLTDAEIQANCDKYGRLYDWSTAMALPSSCNSTSCVSQINSPHRGICPSGWHIPSNEDWDKLMRYVDGTSGTDSPYNGYPAGKYLKATSGWNWDDYDNISGNGEDSHGFSALPGGYGNGGNFYDAGNYGYWWSASEGDSYFAYGWSMGYSGEGADGVYSAKSLLFSVRCVQD